MRTGRSSSRRRRCAAYSSRSARRPSALVGSAHPLADECGGVGPTFLDGEILARLALDSRDEHMSLAIVASTAKVFPAGPFRYVGGSLLRRALITKDAAEDEGQQPRAATTVVASFHDA